MLKNFGGVGMLACGLLLLCAVSSVNSYSKYGRGCGDIGCLPNEECIISMDSCSYNQRDGKDCGSYPTCKRKSGGAGTSSSVNPSVNKKHNSSQKQKLPKIDGQDTKIYRWTPSKWKNHQNNNNKQNPFNKNYYYRN